MLELELATSSTGLIGAKTFNGLRAFVLIEKACRGDVVIELPVDEGARDNGDKANEEEDAEECYRRKLGDNSYEHLHLPWPEHVGLDVAQTIRNCCRNDGGNSVRAVPCCDADGLLSTSVPLTRDDTEQRQTAGFEETKEETRCQQRPEVITSCHCCLSNAPTETKTWHQDSVGDFDDQDRREWLPCKLCNGSN